MWSQVKCVEKWLVSAGPAKAAAGVQQEPSPITAGLVSVVSLKCPLNRFCKHQCGHDLATGIITGWFGFG